MKIPPILLKTLKSIILLGMAWLILDAISPWTAWSPTRDPNDYGWNLFSYFTTDSNLITAAVLILATVAIWRDKAFGGWFRYLRGGAVVYMIITAVVYQVLLADTGTNDWNNFVLHRLAPAFVVLWYILFPSAKSISAKQANWWLAFPVVWTIYTLIRAALIDWYPYPFLNPAEVGGTSGVAIHMIGIALGFTTVSHIVAWISRRRESADSLY